ncbi:hypothetical protein [Streptomyces hydrogenans]|uniref:hypothetical protein n=1 Tax=Streptomyces hydrogenans TaxID=1873719 RepID=UPI0033B9AA58
MSRTRPGEYDSWTGRAASAPAVAGREQAGHPVDQAQVPEARRRPALSQRTLTVRYIWGDLVDAWAKKNVDKVD